MAYKVLVADDDKNIIRSLSYILTREGYQAISAESGADTLSIARKENPDLIILDIMISDKDGYQIYQEMKADVELKMIPVIFISARAEDKHKNWRGLGVKAFITKPFQIEEVKKVVAKVLGERQ